MTVGTPTLRASSAPSSVTTWWRVVVPPLAALVAVLAVWYPLTIPLQGFLPTPQSVLGSFIDAWTSAEFYGHLAHTFRRVVIGAVSSYLTGTAVGIAMGRSKAIEAFTLPWVMVALAIPGPVVILFSVLLIGLTETALLIALWIVVTPFVVNIVYDGVKSFDPGLDDMARVYRLSAQDRFRQVLLPQLAPSLFSAAKVGFALSWKIVVIIEALSLPNGIGGQLELFFRLLQPARVVAWTLSFTVVMIVVEVLVFRNAERRVFAWRKEAKL